MTAVQTKRDYALTRECDYANIVYDGELSITIDVVGCVEALRVSIVVVVVVIVTIGGFDGTCRLLS